MSSRFARRVGVVLLVAAAAQCAALPVEASPGDRCRDADARPGQASYAELGRATLCLVNRERRRRGLTTLRANRRLALAARRHAGDMVRHLYFTHDSLSGARFTSRIIRTGYLRRVGSWRAGENMAWGAGTSATPRAVVRRWMNSHPHRVNVLDPRFRDLGVGVAAGAPVSTDYTSAATYVHDFGFRR